MKIEYVPPAECGDGKLPVRLVSVRWLRWRTTIWQAKKVGTYPNAHVTLGPDDSIEIYVEDGNGQAIGIRIPNRLLARLLAKRINQCLDETK